MSGDGGTGAGQAEVVGDGVESEQSQTWLVTDAVSYTHLTLPTSSYV